MKFPTQFDSHERVLQNVGSREKQLYSPVVGSDGTIVLEESGKEDLYGYIQSHKESVDINVLMQRYQQGDDTALMRAQSFFVDATQFPKTYAGLLQAMIEGEKFFNGLPLEVRQKFDMDFNKFIAGMDDMPSWLAKIGAQQPVSGPAAGENVKDEGVKVADES